MNVFWHSNVREGAVPATSNFCSNFAGNPSFSTFELRQRGCLSDEAECESFCVEFVDFLLD